MNNWLSNDDETLDDESEWRALCVLHQGFNHEWSTEAFVWWKLTHYSYVLCSVFVCAGCVISFPLYSYIQDHPECEGAPKRRMPWSAVIIVIMFGELTPHFCISYSHITPLFGARPYYQHSSVFSFRGCCLWSLLSSAFSQQQRSLVIVTQVKLSSEEFHSTTTTILGLLSLS